MQQPGGLAAVQSRAAALDEAGLFQGTDWASPEILIPALAGTGLRNGGADTVVMETVSELRMLAIASGEYVHPTVSAEDARQFVSQVLAMNLSLLFTPPSEAERVRQGRTAQLVRDLFRHLAEQVGYESRAGQARRGDLAHPAATADPGRPGPVDDHPGRCLPR